MHDEKITWGENWARAITHRKWKLIAQCNSSLTFQETPPDGEQFANVVKHVLGREEFWNNWKNEGCPPFDKQKINASVPIIRKPRKKPVGEDILEGTNEQLVNIAFVSKSKKLLTVMFNLFHSSG